MSVFPDYNFNMNSTEIENVDGSVYSKDESITTEDNKNVNSKIIVTVETTIETLEYEKAIKIIEEKTKNIGGYIESSNIEGTSILEEENRYNRRYADFVIRIPKDKIDEFNEGITEAGKIIDNITQSEDVSSTYFDKEARIQTLKVQEERLLNILSNSNNLSDILELEARLSDVRYEIESLTTTLNKLDNLVEYSTINVHLRETHKLEESLITDSTFLEKIENTFKRTISNFILMIQTLILILISISPYALITILIYVLLRKKIRKFAKSILSIYKGLSINENSNIENSLSKVEHSEVTSENDDTIE